MSADTLLGIDTDLFISEVGLIVTAIAAVVGIWVDRDAERPRSYAIWLTVLVVLATGTGAFQTYQDELEKKQVEGDIARVLQKLDKIVHHGNAEVPALNEVLKDEVAAQANKNPNVVAAIAQRVVDEGGDPKTMFATYLPEKDVQAIANGGQLETAQVDTKIANLDGKTKDSPRPPLTFGSGKAQLRAPKAVKKP